MVASKLMPFLFLLLSAGRGYAQHFDPGVVRVLDAFNGEQSKIDYTGALCAIGSPINGDTLKTNARDMNECVVALCGFPTENKSVYVTNLNFGQYITKDLKTKIDNIIPDLNKALDKTQKNNQDLLAGIESQILKDGAVNSNPKRWSEDFRSNLSKSIFEPFLEMLINLESPIGKRLQIKTNAPPNATEEFKNQLQEYAVNYALFSNNNYTQVMENGLYSDAEMITLAKERLKKLKKLYHDDFKGISDSDRQFYESSVKSTEEMMTNSDEGNIYSIFSNLEYMEEEASKYDSSLKNLVKQPVCENESKCSKIYQEYLEQQNINKRLSDYKKRLVDPKVREKALNSCKAQIIASAVTASDKKAAKTIMMKVKKAMKHNVFTRFSLHSREILEKYFDDQIKTSPKSTNSVLSTSDPFSQFKFKLDIYNIGNPSVASMSQDVALAHALNISDDSDDINAFSDLENPCSDAPGVNAWDAYLAKDKLRSVPQEHLGALADYQNNDHVFVSDFSCHHQLRGKSIVAHELGHAINHIFSTTKLSEKSAKFYKKIRNCATENYVDFIPDRVNFSQTGDGVRTEEDSADLFAYMTFSDKDDLFTCSLIKPSFNEKSYSDLSLILNDGDSHSTPLFRLIMEAANKGVALPISCQKALEPVKDKLRVRKCIP